jgi:hypothetical protein
LGKTKPIRNQRESTNFANLAAVRTIRGRVIEEFTMLNLDEFLKALEFIVKLLYVSVVA